MATRPSGQSRSLLEIDLPVVQPHQLAYPQAAAVEQLHHEPVTPGRKGVQTPVFQQTQRSGQQSRHLFFGEKFRQRLVEPGQRHAGERIAFQAAAPLPEPAKRAQS
jgi:hypothetical protein